MNSPKAFVKGVRLPATMTARRALEAFFLADTRRVGAFLVEADFLLEDFDFDAAVVVFVATLMLL